MSLTADLGSAIVGALPAIWVIVLATLYAVRITHLAADGRPVPLRRQLSFLAGLIVIGVALVSPLNGLADELLTFHMIQHLLIMDVAALLLVLGLTGPIMQPVLALRGLHWVRHLGNPLIALGLWTVLLYMWHIPALYQAATFDSDLVHGLQHTSFLLAGFTFWMSLFGPLPKPAWFSAAAGAGFAAAIRLIGAVLANVLMWSGSAIYSRYMASQAERGVDPLADQGTAGVVMMAESTLVTLSVLVYLILRWARHDTERQELLDLAEARGVELDPQRAERAVNAGQGGRLRERIESS